MYISFIHSSSRWNITADYVLFLDLSYHLKSQWNWGQHIYTLQTNGTHLSRINKSPCPNSKTPIRNGSLQYIYADHHRTWNNTSVCYIYALLLTGRTLASMHTNYTCIGPAPKSNGICSSDRSEAHHSTVTHILPTCYYNIDVGRLSVYTRISFKSAKL